MLQPVTAQENWPESCAMPALLAREAWDVRALYAPRTDYERREFHTSREVAQALLLHPGRFRSPLTMFERLRLTVVATAPNPDFFDWEKDFWHEGGSAVPYAWHVLVRYLERQGVLSPGNPRSSMAHDRVKYLAVRFNLQGEFDKTLSGLGSALDLETAYSKGIGEALERFFLLASPIYQPPAIWASVATLRRRGAPYVSPAHYSQFTTEQKSRAPRLAFDDESLFAWVKAQEVLSDTQSYVPAQLFSFRRFAWQNAREPMLREQNTNAAAGGFTMTEAILSAVYEGIERDGFLVYWLNGIAPPRIDVTSCQDQELQRLMTDLGRYRYEAIFLNTTTDLGIPSCVCFLIDRGRGGPRLTIGAGCGFDVARMLRSSLVEALSVFRGVGYIPEEPTDLSEPYVPFVDNTIDLHGRVRLWLHPDMFPRVEHFLAGPMQSFMDAFPQARNFADAEVELCFVKDILRRMGPGYEMYVYEHRHRILETIGYHVVKVAIPRLVGLYLHESNASLGAQRLKSAPLAMGYPVAKEWYPWPHPFP